MVILTLQNLLIDNYTIPSTSEEQSESLLHDKKRYSVSTSKSNFVGDNESGNHAQTKKLLPQNYEAEAQVAKESEKISKKQQGQEPKFTL